MDASTPVGTWYLSANGFRLELSIRPGGNGLADTIKNEGAAPERLDSITWDPAARWLEFPRNGPGFFQWYRICLTYGVMAGRFSHAAVAPKPALTAYANHVAGGSTNWLDSDIVPRTWNLTINNNFKAVLRIDRDASNVLRGRLKVFDDSSQPGVQEELENDLTSITWDGTNLSFTRSAGFVQIYNGQASGRFLNGTFTHNGGAPAAWSGVLGEVLGFGLGSRLPQRDAW